MKTRAQNWMLVVAIVGGVGFALFRPSKTPAASAPSVEAASPGVVPPVPDDLGAEAPIDHAHTHGTTAGLPPNHPPIGDSPLTAPLADSTETPALQWNVPKGWQTMPNPNTMRLATYRVPAAKGDSDATELTVARAGGSTDANIQRWLGQFDDAGQDVRTERLVRGLKVTMVEVSGTFLGGGMTPGAPSSSHRGWALLAAIVETSGNPYFFKMIGPAGTVGASRAAFRALVDSLAPSSSAAVEKR